MVTTTQPAKAPAELTGIDAYMEPKIQAARLIEPGSAHEIAAMGGERHALVLATMRIGLGAGGALVRLARAMLYLINEDKRIKEERDAYFILTEQRERKPRGWVELRQHVGLRIGRYLATGTETTSKGAVDSRFDSNSARPNETERDDYREWASNSGEGETD